MSYLRLRKNWLLLSFSFSYFCILLVLGGFFLSHAKAQRHEGVVCLVLKSVREAKGLFASVFE